MAARLFAGTTCVQAPQLDFDALADPSLVGQGAAGPVDRALGARTTFQVFGWIRSTRPEMAQNLSGARLNPLDRSRDGPDTWAVRRIGSAVPRWRIT